VKEVGDALEAISEQDLRARFNPARMNQLEIYPGNWEEEDNLEWLIDAFRDVKIYFRAAAREGQAMILYLT